MGNEVKKNWQCLWNGLFVEKLEGNRTMNMAQRDKTFNSFTVHKLSFVNSASHDAPLPLRPSKLFHANPNCI